MDINQLKAFTNPNELNETNFVPMLGLFFNKPLTILGRPFGIHDWIRWSHCSEVLIHCNDGVTRTVPSLVDYESELLNSVNFAELIREQVADDRYMPGLGQANQEVVYSVIADQMEAAVDPKAKSDWDELIRYFSSHISVITEIPIDRLMKSIPDQASDNGNKKLVDPKIDDEDDLELTFEDEDHF